MTDASDYRRNSLWLAPTNLVMPQKGGNSALTDDDLKAVIDYMRRTFAR